jgi:hypothetical protein
MRPPKGNDSLFAVIAVFERNSPMIDPPSCPPGSLAWQQYQVNLASGRAVTLAFSLADPGDAAMARMKARHGAAHLGLLVVLDDPDSVEEAVVWFHQTQALTLLSQHRDMVIGDEVRALLPRYFSVFFDDVKALAPQLSQARLALAETGGKTLH